MNKKYLLILIHVLGWVAFFVFPFVLLNFPAEPHMAPLREMRHPNDRHAMLPFFIINNLLFIVFFYLNLFYLLPALYYRQKKLAYFSATLVILLAAVYLPSVIKAELIHHPPGFQRPGGRPFHSMDRLFGFFHFLIIWFLSSMICLAQRYRAMEQGNKEMRVQKLGAELSYLKAQVNPHFLFNTLNNIYALSICQSEQTPEAILKLSSIMRYVTEDAEAEKVPLEKELEYLSNYIDLQQLRSNTNLDLSFHVEGDPAGKMIAPLLLINFIENAFKHGVSNHVKCFVDIHIKIVYDELTLQVVNQKLEGIHAPSTSTGSSNTTRQLQLQYPDKHLLTVDEQDNLYKVTLQLNLA